MNIRPRRNRRHDWLRRLVAETRLSADDFIYPIFLGDGKEQHSVIPSMPGITRLNLESLYACAEQCLELGIPAIALFPHIEAIKKNEDGSESWNVSGLIPNAIGELKNRFPELGVIADVALDPYTSHGQDGVIDDTGYVLNDATNECLTKQSLCLAAAGADVLAPSDMMDGRVAVIRDALEEQSFTDIAILSYAAKYASSLYAPFRDAVGSGQKLGKSDKRSYQMDIRNSDEALLEIALDIDEGADMIMVKPAGMYLDVIRTVSEHSSVPTLAYQVSGEYAMIKAAGQQQWVDEAAVALESLIAIKRSGARAILTYFALEAARTWV